MPKFEVMKPEDVLLGRGRAAAEERQAYVAAIQAGDAGKIILDTGDRPSSVKRRLTEASKEVGIRVRSTWEDKRQKTLLWKRVGA